MTSYIMYLFWDIMTFKYYGSNKSTELETGKTHLCVVYVVEYIQQEYLQI